MNTWTEFKQYEPSSGLLWWPVLEGKRFHGAMYGKRSDGEKFFRLMELDSLDEAPEKIAEASRDLETRLNCQCRVGSPCGLHTYYVIRDGAMWSKVEKTYNPETEKWEQYDPMSEKYVNRRRVAAIPLQAEQILGLLKGTLRPEPPLPSDADLYLYADEDGVAKAQSKGVWLGVRSLSLDSIREGSMLPELKVQFAPVNEWGQNNE